MLVAANQPTLSIRQPYVDAILSREKLIENRDWKTQYRGPLLIHASGKHPELQTGVILGFVELVGILEHPGHQLGLYSVQKMIRTVLNRDLDLDHIEQHWDYHSKFWWIFDNPIRFKKPIPAKGKLNLWQFSGDLPRQASKHFK